jgi:hypothetical protein
MSLTYSDLQYAKNTALRVRNGEILKVNRQTVMELLSESEKVYVYSEGLGGFYVETSKDELRRALNGKDGLEYRVKYDNHQPYEAHNAGSVLWIG